ncbi:MAG TPA: acetoacetate decarboxylase family protein [Anaerolineales bacterium]|nr:acetoacetate decarboxylase family protein [Anaerolineales bacterium]
MDMNPNNYYKMPLIMGPMWEGAPPNFKYEETEIVALQYLTDSEAISALLPDCYSVGKEPQVTVVFGYNNGLDFMAGGGYNLAAVQVSARFDGEKDHIEGDFNLVMFEDKTWPIIGGREDLGVPKLFANISPIKIYPNGRLRCEASYFGHLLYSLELSPPKKQNAIVRLAANKIINSRPWLAYKYIPSLDGPPDADYPTITYNDTKINTLWTAKSGQLKFGNAEREDISYYKPLVDALKTLEIMEIKQALHFQGSAVLRYDRSRRLA